MNTLLQIKSIFFRLRFKRIIVLALLIALSVYAYIDMSKFWALLGITALIILVIRLYPTWDDIDADWYLFWTDTHDSKD